MTKKTSAIYALADVGGTAAFAVGDTVKVLFEYADGSPAAAVDMCSYADNLSVVRADGK